MEAFKTRRQRLGISQRELARRAKVAFRTVQLIESGGHDPRWSTICRLARTLGIEAGKLDSALAQCLVPQEDSVAAVSAKMAREGAASWRGWLFELVDAFRKTRDAGLLQEPPVAALNKRLRALLACVVEALCDEEGVRAPAWCLGIGPLEAPWFPAGMESLKASALVESPAQFRRRNIFVLGNFLARA